MHTSAINRIAENLDEVFRGDSWHGPSVTETLRGLNENDVFLLKNNSKYSIAQHVFHMAKWREFVIEKLIGNFNYKIDGNDGDFLTNEALLDKSWVKIIDMLNENQTRLLEVILTFDDAKLEKNVPGLDYDFYKLLNGLIQHDTYHLGMIWVLWE